MADQFLGGKALGAGFNDTRGGIPTRVGPYIGVVMDNSDATRSGRVRVWLKSHSSDNKNNEEHWRTVSYLSPFYGVTPHKVLASTDNPSFENNGHAYGMWMTAPDIGVEVLCFFVEGDPNKGFYVGFIPEPQMNQMLPGTGAKPIEKVIFDNPTQEAAFAEAKQLPTIEIHKSKEGMNDSSYFDRPKPVHSVLAAQMWQAGTITDNTRGPITSSSQRESPSFVYGVSTPGRPVYQGGILDATFAQSLSGATAKDLAVAARRGGHSFVMDDGDLEGHDVLMRFRTSTGHQILMSDDGAVIHIIHANGQTWVELGNEGTVDIYAANSINLRSQGEVNIHADKDINMHSGQDIKFFAKRDIKFEAEKNFNIVGKQKVATYSEKAIEVKSDGTLKTQSSGKTSIKAGGNIIEQGAQIRLNCEAADTITKPPEIRKNPLPDTVFEQPTGWKSKPSLLNTIVTRAPTHEPYPYHNQGVPVKVNLEGSAAPAPTPAKTAAKVTAAAVTPPPNPVTPAEVVKQGQALGEVRDIAGVSKQEVVAMMTQQAKTVNQALDAVTDKGIGKFGIKPEMLTSLGFIKPGLADLTKLSPAQLTSFLSDASVFTGKDGIGSITDILNSETIQGTIVQNGMEFAMSELKATGLLTGLEKAQDVASMLSGAMNASPGDLVDWVSGKASSAVNNALNAAASAGQFASKLATTKAKDLIDNSLAGVQSLTSSASKSIQDLVGTVKRANVDQAVDNIIGNAKIPSFAAISNNVQSQIKLASGQITGIVDQAGNLVNTAGNIAASAQNVATKITGQAQNLAGTTIDKVGNVFDTAGNVVGKVVNTATDLLNGDDEDIA